MSISNIIDTLIKIQIKNLDHFNQVIERINRQGIDLIKEEGSENKFKIIISKEKQTEFVKQEIDVKKNMNEEEIEKYSNFIDQNNGYLTIDLENLKFIFEYQNHRFEFDLSMEDINVLRGTNTPNELIKVVEKISLFAKLPIVIHYCKKTTSFLGTLASLYPTYITANHLLEEMIQAIDALNYEVIAIDTLLVTSVLIVTKKITERIISTLSQKTINFGLERNGHKYQNTDL